MRTAFIEKITEMARKDSNLYLLTGDLGFSVIEDFKKEFPNRFYNVGIAEQTMAGIAAGLSLSGKTVFTYSIASFATMRCYEQIRNDIAYHNLKIRIVGVSSGFSYSNSGFTHHSESDVGIMRCIPNMTIIAPGDPIEVEKAMDKSVDFKGPIYFRLGRKGEPYLHDENVDFSIGKGIVMKEGKDIALISSGNTLEVTKEIAEELEKQGISVRLISMHTIKPIDRLLVLDTLSRVKTILTIEEHNIIGGLGSAVAEIIAESDLKTNVHFKRIGIKDKFCEIAGDHDFIVNHCDMSKQKIIDEALADVKKW